MTHERSNKVLFWAIVAVLCVASVLWGMCSWLFLADYRGVIEDLGDIEPVDTDQEAREAVRAAEAIVRAHERRGQKKREGV